MYKKFIIYYIIILLISSCQKQQVKSTFDNNNYKFNSFSLDQKLPNGKKNWTLTSPSASYDPSLKAIVAYTPVIFLFKLNQPTTRITANKLSVFNNGDIIKLNGNVKVNDLIDDQFIIEGEDVLWTTKKSTLLFNGSNILKSKSNDRSNKYRKNFIIQGYDTNWNSTDGRIYANGPVISEFINIPDGTKEYIRSRNLEGNTITNFIRFDKCNYESEIDISSSSDSCTFLWNKRDKLSDTIFDKIILMSGESEPVTTIINIP